NIIPYGLTSFLRSLQFI
ncbi:hypothetical protein VN97_g12963, partial [Penicillium thymicola]